jgi:hypothetical protein
MDDANFGAPLPPPAPFAPVLVEDVPRGLLFSLAAVVGGAALTIIAWRIGFVASITSFVLAAGAVFLYTKGAGVPPRKGMIPLLVVIVIGIAVSFFGVIASDAWDAYDKLGVTGQTRTSFISDNVFRGEIIRSYGKDMVWFFVFAVLGVFSTVRRMLAAQAFGPGRA